MNCLPRHRNTNLFIAIALGVALLSGLTSCSDNPVDDKDPGDTTRPTVVSTVPFDNDSTASVNTIISVNFSEEMDAATMIGSTLLLNPPISGSTSYSGKTLTFTPAAPLDTNAAYQATVATTARDTAGNALGTAYIWRFYTYRDTIPPTVMSTTPAPDDSATVNTDISIVFSEVMDVSTLNSGSIIFDPPIAGSIAIQAARQVVFTPAVPLDTFVVYTATVTTAVTDSAGNHMTDDYVWQFRTVRDWIPPTVMLSRPSDQNVFEDSLRIQVEASDDDSLSHVEFYADGALIFDATDNASGYYQFTWRPTGLSLGSAHGIYAIAYDLAGNYSHSDTVTVHYLWRLLVDDNNEAIPRNLAQVYARSTLSQLQFRVETWTGWSNYKDSAGGIDVAIFLDTDRNPATGDRDTYNGTLPIGDIGADYQLIIGYHGDIVQRWNASGWVTDGGVEDLLISGNSNFFEVSLSLAQIEAPSAVDIIVANFILATFQWDWAPNVDSVPPDHVTLTIDRSYSGSPPSASAGMESVRPGPTIFD